MIIVPLSSFIIFYICLPSLPHLPSLPGFTYLSLCQDSSDQGRVSHSDAAGFQDARILNDLDQANAEAVLSDPTKWIIEDQPQHATTGNPRSNVAKLSTYRYK